MLELTLLDAMMNLTKKYQLSAYQKNKCHNFFSLLKIDDQIYAGQLKSKLVIDIKQAYLMLDELKEQGYLQIQYEVYCKDCHHSKGIFLDCLTDFNENTCCDWCNKQLNSLDDLIVLYKVVKLCH